MQFCGAFFSKTAKKTVKAAGFQTHIRRLFAHFHAALRDIPSGRVCFFAAARRKNRRLPAHYFSIFRNVANVSGVSFKPKLYRISLPELPRYITPSETLQLSPYSRIALQARGSRSRSASVCRRFPRRTAPRKIRTPGAPGIDIGRPKMYTIFCAF